MRHLLAPLLFTAQMLVTLSATAQVLVEHAYARATFDGAMSSAAYMTLVNQSDEPITLTSASVPSALVGEVQIHTTIMQDDMMKMVHVHEGVVIPAGESFALAPGGYHIMLMGLKKGLSEGESLPITLHFDKQEAVTIEAAVKRIDKSHHHHHH